MKMLTVYLICAFASVEGSSLWSLSQLPDKGLHFLEKRDSNDSVRVEAYVQDVSPVKTIKFLLFTGKFHNGVELHDNDNSTLKESGFNPEMEVKIIIHGFANSASSKFSTLLKNAYLKYKKVVNVIVVDWSDYCKPPFYSSAVDSAKQVGAATADLIAWLMSRGVSLSRVHILGHSVGAHIAGVVGRIISYRGLGQVRRITGLDLAKPMFEVEAASVRLSLYDAQFVDCIHTCGGFLGLSDAVCHVDFYPNGGTSPQPGCQFDFFGICSHQRAYKYYIETISYPRAFKAVGCSAVENYSPTDCTAKSETFMGENLDVGTRGIFYFATASSSPFSLKDYTMSITDFQRFSWYFM
ncbi:pancreatic triacylglycerol lipase-like [Macrosteles quadrilineatus]|uniref:pancreatic triacylglycerol lipase-like n=1 Tax=Macrosteles quadrilineatus TaxID=74068 RepID=UPI0023E1E3A3|nr:pancreatic triacylglycerol lipase-like [Macrosteles quadrilineatus]